MGHAKQKRDLSSLRPAWTKISLRIRAVWLRYTMFASKSGKYSAYFKEASQRFFVNSVDPDQTARMRRLNWIYAGHKDEKHRSFLCLFFYVRFNAKDTNLFCNPLYEQGISKKMKIELISLDVEYLWFFYI